MLLINDRAAIDERSDLHQCNAGHIKF
jgi:hypothetical protein